MDLEDLRVFVETVRRGSLSLAAEALDLSQPTVSRRIRRMETEMGAPLIERRRPAVSPTRLGLELLSFAEGTLQRWDTMRGAQRNATPPLRGALHIVSSTTPGEFLVPALLARFAQVHTDVRAHLHIMNSDSVEECVRAHHCDVGFLGRLPRSPLLRGIAVAEDEVVLAVPAGHRFAQRSEIDLDEISGEALVLREPGSGTRQAVEAALAAHHVSLPPHRVVSEMGNGRALVAAVAAGQGIGFVSALLSGGPRVRLQGLPIRRPLLLVYDPSRLRRVTEIFVAFVSARLPLQPLATFPAGVVTATATTQASVISRRPRRR